MRVALLSDIHGNDCAFEAVVRDMAQFKINYVVFLGDLVAKGPDPMACYKRLLGLRPMVWLKGNTEFWLDNAMTDILPTTRENISLLAYYDYLVKHMDGKSMDDLINKVHYKKVQMGHFEGICCHGSLRDVNEVMDPINKPEVILDQLKHEKAAFVFSGHSHSQYDQVVKGIRMVNPGAVGLGNPGKEGLAEYAIVEVGRSFTVNLRQVSYDFDLYKAICMEKNFLI